MPNSKSFEDRFWEKVEKTKTCWLWHGATRPNKGNSQNPVNNYGNVWKDGRYLAAHRAAWELAYGAIPKNALVLHACDNPPCVRPDHLFLGTPLSNITDMDNKGRRKNGLPLSREKNPNVQITWEKVIWLRERYAQGDISAVALAEQSGLSYSGLYHVLNNTTWRDNTYIYIPAKAPRITIRQASSKQGK